MRTFEFAGKMENGKPVIESDERNCRGEVKAFPDARLPEYQTRNSAGADFFCAEEVTIPSIWDALSICNGMVSVNPDLIKPTLVHTGIKASMEHDEVLEL